MCRHCLTNSLNDDWDDDDWDDAAVKDYHEQDIKILINDIIND